MDLTIHRHKPSSLNAELASCMLELLVQTAGGPMDLPAVPGFSTRVAELVMGAVWGRIGVGTRKN